MSTHFVLLLTCIQRTAIKQQSCLYNYIFVSSCFCFRTANQSSFSFRLTDDTTLPSESIPHPKFGFIIRNDDEECVRWVML
ncbi:MAG: hypothetical protein ACKPKO_23890 [Candidatus Fonsibacter sp.]